MDRDRNVLCRLRELAIVESAEPSNRIEGEKVEPSRRRPADQYLGALGKSRLFRVKLLLAVPGAGREFEMVVPPWEASVSDCSC